jgi:hypothetical protein
MESFLEASLLRSGHNWRETSIRRNDDLFLFSIALALRLARLMTKLYIMVTGA